MSALSYVSGVWKRCLAAARSVVDGRDRTGGSDTPVAVGRASHDDAADPGLLVAGQLLWMAVTLVALYWLALLSVRLYFLVSFIGLLCNRVLFAPRVAAGRWWRVLNAVTWLCFALLSYILYRRILPA